MGKDSINRTDQKASAPLSMFVTSKFGSDPQGIQGIETISL